MLPLLLLLLAQSPLDQAGKQIQSGDTRVALETLRQLACPDAVCEARKQSLTGTAHLYGASYDEALAAFRAALDLNRRAKDFERIIDLLNNIGSVHLYRGRYAEAYSAYSEAAKLLDGQRSQSWYPSSRQLTTVNLATLEQKLGRNRQALVLYQSVDASKLPASEQSQLLSNRATLVRRLGDPYKCKQLLEQALKLLERQPNLDIELGILKNLGIVLALDFKDYAAANRTFERVRTRADQAADRRESLQARLYQAELAYRSGHLADAGRLWQQTLVLTKEVEAGEEGWRSLYGLARVERRRELAIQTLEAIESLRSGIGAASMKTDFLADKSEAFDLALDLEFAAQNPTAAFTTMERARALNLREALPQKPRLLSLQEFQGQLAPDETALLMQSNPTATYLMWVHKSATRLVKLDVTERQIAQWVQQEKYEELRDLLFANSRWPENRLWIIPDGPLSGVPLELLVPERLETAYLPAAWMMEPLPPASRGWRWPWQLQLTAISSPITIIGNPLPGDESLAPLPQSRMEVDSIASLLNGGAQHLSVATMEQLNSAPILHFATHAVADRESAARNRILLSDRYLFPAQFGAGSLSKVELAVLSACDTSLGAQVRIEGTQSMARSFLAAGARATIASYWKVEDQATRQFMELLYANLKNGQPYATALHRTRQQAREAGASARVWAAFTVQGSARESLARVISWTQLGAIVVIALSGLALLLSKFR